MAVSAEVGIPSSIYADGQNVSFTSLHQAFLESKYGHVLEGEVRWKMFKPGEVNKQDWKKALGVDANNLDHLGLSVGLTEPFLRYCEQPPADWGDRPVSEEAKFSTEEKELFRLTGGVHDWGESIMGDTAQPMKKRHKELREAVHLMRIAKEIVPGSELNAKIRHIVKCVVLNTETKLGKAFNAFEIAGYFRTAMKAWKLYEAYQEDDKQGLRGAHRGIVLTVHVHNVGKLLDYARIYPPLFAQVMAYKDQIDQIYTMDSQVAAEQLFVFEREKWDVPGLKSLFEQNREKWHEWKEEFVASGSSV